LSEGPAARVMSLRDGTKKMSSSDPSDAARINMTDDADTVAKKVRRATSDSGLLPDPSVVGADGQFAAAFRDARPEAANLLTIFAALTDRPLAEVVAGFEGKGFADFKQELTDVAVATLGHMVEDMKRLVNDPSYVDSVLHEGAERSRALAEPILAEVYDILGFLRP